MGTGLLLAAVALLALAGLLVLAHGIPAGPVTAARPPKPLPADLTPRDFERHCAEILAARGWSVTLGRGSADQGVDVLARKGGRSVVLQCKLYGRPVGNKAVQEALAGRGYAGADGAAVVSNAAYTPAAHALAARVGILLLHTADLVRADSLFRFPRGEAPPAEEDCPAPPRQARRPARRRPALRWPGAALPALAFAGFILLFPRLAPQDEDASPRRAPRAGVPLPPPSPPPPGRRG